MAKYLAELYLSRAAAADLRGSAERARTAAAEMTRAGTPIRFLRSLFLGEEEVCFHLYDAPSPEAVSEVSRRAAISIERVMEAIDIELGELKEG